MGDESFNCLLELCNDRTPTIDGWDVGETVARALDGYLRRIGCPGEADLRTREGQELARAWWRTVRCRVIPCGEGWRRIEEPLEYFHSYDLIPLDDG